MVVDPGKNKPMKLSMKLKILTCTANKLYLEIYIFSRKKTKKTLVDYKYESFCKSSFNREMQYFLCRHECRILE